MIFEGPSRGQLSLAPFVLANIVRSEDPWLRCKQNVKNKERSPGLLKARRVYLSISASQIYGDIIKTGWSRTKE